MSDKTIHENFVQLHKNINYLSEIAQDANNRANEAEYNNSLLQKELEATRLARDELERLYAKAMEDAAHWRESAERWYGKAIERAGRASAREGVDNLLDELSSDIDSMSDEEIRAEADEDGITGEGVRRVIESAIASPLTDRNRGRVRELADEYSRETKRLMEERGITFTDRNFGVMAVNMRLLAEHVCADERRAKKGRG